MPSASKRAVRSADDPAGNSTVISSGARCGNAGSCAPASNGEQRTQGATAAPSCQHLLHCDPAPFLRRDECRPGSPRAMRWPARHPSRARIRRAPTARTPPAARRWGRSSRRPPAAGRVAAPQVAQALVQVVDRRWHPCRRCSSRSAPRPTRNSRSAWTAHRCDARARRLATSGLSPGSTSRAACALTASTGPSGTRARRCSGCRSAASRRRACPTRCSATTRGRSCRAGRG